MVSRVRDALSYSNVIATLALVIALGGTSYAAVTLGKNSVTSRNIAKGAVTSAKIHNGAVTGAKIAHGAVTAIAVKAGRLSRTTSLLVWSPPRLILGRRSALLAAS